MKSMIDGVGYTKEKTEKIDLRTLEKGDTVHFRGGGSAVIESIKDTLPNGSWDDYRYQIHFVGSQYPFVPKYQQIGTYRGTDVVDLFDIIRIEKSRLTGQRLSRETGLNTLTAMPLAYWNLWLCTLTQKRLLFASILRRQTSIQDKFLWMLWRL